MLRRAVNQLYGAAVSGSATTGTYTHMLNRTFMSSAAHATTVLCVRKDGEVRHLGNICYTTTHTLSPRFCLLYVSPFFLFLCRLASAV